MEIQIPHVLFQTNRHCKRQMYDYKWKFIMPSKVYVFKPQTTFSFGVKTKSFSGYVSKNWWFIWICFSSVKLKLKTASGSTFCRDTFVYTLFVGRSRRPIEYLLVFIHNLNIIKPQDSKLNTKQFTLPVNYMAKCRQCASFMSSNVYL